MEWVWIVLVAHLLYAGVFVVDSLLINKHLENATSYAFFVSILGLAALLLAPFGFELIGMQTLLLAFLAGAGFTFGTLFLYRGLQKHETSRIVPLIGGTIPIFTFLLSFIFLPEQLAGKQLLAFLILAGGTVLIVYPFHKEKKHHMKAATIIEMIIGALLFACWGVLAKRVFLETTFISGVVWIRIGAAIAGLLLLAGPKLRKEILHGKRRLKIRSSVILLANKSAGAIAGLLIYYSLFRGNATLVHSLQGVQYVFLFGLVVFLSQWFPKIFKEDLRPGLLAQKLGSSIIIAFGVALLLT